MQQYGGHETSDCEPTELRGLDQESQDILKRGGSSELCTHFGQKSRKSSPQEPCALFMVVTGNSDSGERVQCSMPQQRVPGEDALSKYTKVTFQKAVCGTFLTCTHSST